MKNYYKIILLFAFIVSSCHVEGVDRQDDIVELNFSNSFKERERVNLSTIVTNIEYIQLQGDSTCYLGQIYDPKRKIQFSQDKILISDAGNKLLLFDSSGKFLNKIGNVGRGPEDYIKPDNFTFIQGEDKPLIVVFSAVQHKMIFYDYQGRFIKTKPVDFWPNGLISYKNDLVFINSIGRRKESNYFNFHVLDLEGKLKKQVFFKENEKDIEKHKQLGMSSMNNRYIFRDSLSFWESGYDTVYRISSDYDMIPKYVINIGDNVIPIEEQTRGFLKDFNKKIKYDRVLDVKESKRYFFINILYKKQAFHIYYDKILRENHSIGFKSTLVRKKMQGNFYNNIDGGINFWPIGSISENKMYMLVYGYELKDYLDRQVLDLAVLDKQGRERLLELAESASVSDNPILMVVTLKK